jgi:DNA modification methylase
MAWMIESLTKPGQVVLDCFCGLGSTLIAAEQLGRNWIGCDLSRNYCKIAMRRLKTSETGIALSNSLRKE